MMKLNKVRYKIYLYGQATDRVTHTLFAANKNQYRQQFQRAFCLDGLIHFIYS